MSRFYYTVSSLPVLSYEKAPPLSKEQFMEMCRSELTQRERDMLQKTELDSLDVEKGEHPFLRQWKNWERQLRNALAVLRAGKKGEDPSLYLRGENSLPEHKKTAREALEAASPLLSEDMLNRARWDFLNELGGLHFFNMEWIIVYYLKLLVLVRKQKFQADAGNEEFKALLAHITDKIKTGV